MNSLDAAEAASALRPRPPRGVNRPATPADLRTFIGSGTRNSSKRRASIGRWSLLARSVVNEAEWQSATLASPGCRSTQEPNRSRSMGHVRGQKARFRSGGIEASRTTFFSAERTVVAVAHPRLKALAGSPPVLHPTPLPNPSLKRNANGSPPGPRGGSCHHPPRGPGGKPSSSA